MERPCRSIRKKVFQVITTCPQVKNLLHKIGHMLVAVDNLYQRCCCVCGVALSVVYVHFYRYCHIVSKISATTPSLPACTVLSHKQEGPLPWALHFRRPSSQMGCPDASVGKETTYGLECRRHRRCRFDSWVGKIPRGGKWQPTPVFLPGEAHGQRSLAGYSPWSCKESDTIKQLSPQATA